MMNIPLGDFARGVANPPSFAVGQQRVAPNICFEDLFGEELARRFIDPALAPTIFANISNIAWFGPSAINAQHLNISRLRSLEFQRPMIRATNTGATAIVDFRGHVQAQLQPYTRDVLQGEVQAIKNEYKQHLFRVEVQGDWPADLTGEFQVVRQDRNGVTIQLTDDSHSNELLRQLMQKGIRIIRFEEILPTFNEIFIRTVEQAATK